MRYIIDLIFNLCDCFQVLITELVSLILQPIFFVIRTVIQWFDIFGVDIYPQTEDEENNNKQTTIGFRR